MRSSSLWISCLGISKAAYSLKDLEGTCISIMISNIRTIKLTQDDTTDLNCQIAKTYSTFREFRRIFARSIIITIFCTTINQLQNLKILKFYTKAISYTLNFFVPTFWLIQAKIAHLHVLRRNDRLQLNDMRSGNVHKRKDGIFDQPFNSFPHQKKTICFE